MKEGKYEERIVTLSIARLEAPNWGFARLGIHSIGNSLTLEFAPLRIVHLGIVLHNYAAAVWLLILYQANSSSLPRSCSLTNENR
uniref:Uncharacterized protein n=1 Tax=Romanomermis culicivorax TaxID=13658 RepID=A0A915I3M5_ROMCU